MNSIGRTRTERRLAAILAADVAGYSRLIGADEEGTLDRLKSVRAEVIDPKIDEHHGRLVKTTGDGLLIEFASVVDALRCAVEVEQEMARRNSGLAEAERIEFRIGIHQGDIVIESGDILGDGVNVAARLEGLAEPGGICVSARVQEDVAGKLDVTFDDLGEQSLKNIARPIRVFRIRLRVAVDPSSSIATGNTPAWGLPDKPSIAVLPFTNMSNDPEQEYFGDGIAEDIITALSHYPSLFVIARNSSFTYKGRAVAVREVGRDLGVRYVLEGSLRKSANRVRVTAQLVEAATGNHVWAERYDRDLADIFAVQDEITEAVSVAIAPAIAEAEQQRAMRKPPGSLDAWAAYQRGLWYLAKVTAEDFATAQELFERGIEADRTFAGCYTGLALAKLQASAIYQSLDANEAQRSAEALARRAVACDGNDAEARSCLGWALQARGELDGGLIEIDRALEISPNLAVAHAQRGATLIFIGRPKEGIRAIEGSIRLDPRDPFSAVRLLHIACGLYFSGEYEATVEATKRLSRSYPNFPMIYRWSAAALGQLGRGAEAKEALDKAMNLAPAAFDMYVRNRVPWFRSEDHLRLVEGLRKAGWDG
jgi:adenylate cyclase